MYSNFLTTRCLSIVTLTVVLILLGCSSGGSGSIPVLPDSPSFETNSEIPGLTGNMEAKGESESGHYMLLYGMISVDPYNPDGPKVEIIPLREGEIHLNILKLLEDGPCFDCFKIVGFEFPEPGILDVDIQIDHPFDDLDFSVFDVRGIMMFQGSHEFPAIEKSTSDPALGDGALLNADGYTALYNGNTIDAPVGPLQKYYEGNFATPEIPNSDINGYKYYTTDNPANNRNAFYAASSDIQTFSIKLPTSPFVLGYAVDANWWPPIESPVDDPLTDFDLNANCPEPWKIVVTEEPIGDGLTDQGGSTKLTIDVYDWQGKDTHHDPVVECPEIFDSQLTATWVSDGSDYARYEVTVSNAKSAGVGDYMCLIGVEANENDPVAKLWLDLTAYYLQTLTVIEKITVNPIAVAEADPNPQFVNQPVSFSASDSYDPDGGNITLYEWDWNNDGTYDGTGENVDHTWTSPGNYLIQLRVTDDESQTDTLDVPLEITINMVKVPPIAIATADPLIQYAGQPITFSDDGSYDPDGGSIIKYEWDWDNDGTYDEEGIEADHSWSTEGTYHVQLRVTDDEAQTDTLDEPLEVVILPVGGIVIFPDPVLEQKVREAINKPVGDIYVGDLLGLIELDASVEWDDPYKITDIEGIQFCINLVALDLSNNAISLISQLQNLTALIYLNLAYNYLTDITPLQNLTALIWLRLDDNDISDITPLQNLTALTELDITENQISDITPLQNLTALTYLNLGFNSFLSDITPLQNLTALTGLGLHWNQISVITPLQNLTALTWLELETNQISDITPLQNLTALTRLRLSKNSISDITPLQNLTALTRLWLWDNEISDITPLQNLTALTDLSLQGNQISDITPLQNLTALIELDINENQISDITPLQNLTALTWLRLWDNEISDITPLQNLTGLTDLWLMGNQISDITPLHNLTGLTDLWLIGNQISDITPLQNLTALIELGISGNFISDITPLQNLTTLIELDIAGNQLSDITPLQNLTSLTELGLGGNEISDIYPLVLNSYNGGLGSGDQVSLEYNPLSDESKDVYIPQLQANGVVVIW